MKNLNKQIPVMEVSHSLDFAALDFEMTGTGPEPSITEASVGIFESGKLKYDYTSYVYTFSHIRKKIRCLTGIEKDYLKNAPTFMEVMEHIVFLIEDLPIVGHGVRNEKMVLERYFDRVENRFSNNFIDTHSLAKSKLPRLGCYTLSNLLDTLEIDRAGDAHTARSDMLATAELYLRLVEINKNSE